MIEYHFDGTYIDFFIACLDVSGKLATGQSGNITVAMYDSALNADAATIAIAEIGTSGIYRIRTTYTNLNRAAGDGVWTWTFTHSAPDYNFDPRYASIQISRDIGTVNNTNFTPTTTEAEFDGLNDTSTDHYKLALFYVLTGTEATAVRDITASVLSNGRVKLTWTGALPSAMVNGDRILIINR